MQHKIRSMTAAGLVLAVGMAGCASGRRGTAAAPSSRAAHPVPSPTSYANVLTLLAALNNAGLVCTDPTAADPEFANVDSAMTCSSAQNATQDTIAVVFSVPGFSTVYANATARPGVSVAHGANWAVAAAPTYADRVAAALGGTVTSRM